MSLNEIGIFKGYQNHKGPDIMSIFFEYALN